MGCGQCKDCRWWEDPITADSEYFDCCGVCHMMTFTRSTHPDEPIPKAETSLIQKIWFDYSISSNRDIIARACTPRFFRCMMFEPRKD